MARPPCTAVVFDTVVRYLRYRGYDVTYVRNFTDVDDKIINKSIQQGVESAEIARKFIAEYRSDMTALGTLAPDVEPLATEHIADMIRVIGRWWTRAMPMRWTATSTSPWTSFPGYGKLSGRDPEEMHRRQPHRRGRAQEEPAGFRPVEERPSRANPGGRVPGARAGRAGTSNARP